MSGATIVSIQSQLVFGCAGNSAAVPLLQRLGATVHAVPTTLLSNTPHYPTIAGGPLDPALVEALLDRLLDRIAPTAIGAILTGYIASPGAAAAAARFIDRVRTAHGHVLVHCDPVMGDTDTGLYVNEAVAAAIAADLVPRADILTPNLFEARRLTGLPDGDPHAVLERLLTSHARIAAITGIDPGDGFVTTLGGDGKERWRVRTPKLALRPTGTGDVFSAAFLHALLHGADTPGALERGVKIVFDLMETAYRTGARELDPGGFAPRPAEGPVRFAATFTGNTIDRASAT
ncbi:pyridoxal kinase [Marinicauda algicola]|uniref:pyridoxal kinase n=1 Tax=Marinicauda algicola TaxID=2029849 RepID=A0A4S2H4U5_9PROT|nr:pyridoxal kinase [Marinicauda algicola]TGY90687.1 pyridoxal kinase [Marinicauda algicola]